MNELFGAKYAVDSGWAAIWDTVVNEYGSGDLNTAAISGGQMVWEMRIVLEPVKTASLRRRVAMLNRLGKFEVDPIQPHGVALPNTVTARAVARSGADTLLTSPPAQGQPAMVDGVFVEVPGSDRLYLYDASDGGITPALDVDVLNGAVVKVATAKMSGRLRERIRWTYLDGGWTALSLVVREAP